MLHNCNQSQQQLFQKLSIGYQSNQIIIEKSWGREIVAEFRSYGLRVHSSGAGKTKVSGHGYRVTSFKASGRHDVREYGDIEFFLEDVTQWQ